MDEKTLEALKGSVRKWTSIVAGKGKSLGYENCPLCKIFQANYEKKNCNGCPVAERTGKPYCRDTPYDDWADAEDAIGGINNNKATTEELKLAAKAELDFLRSLLPAEATQSERLP